MKLENPFTIEIRVFYMYDHECVECKGNGSDCGGLEIHHILGRVSSSILNSAILCKKCHAKMCHSQPEEQKLFAIILRRCYNQGYKLSTYDFEFIDKNYRRLFTEDLEIWLSQLSKRKSSSRK